MRVRPHALTFASAVRYLLGGEFTTPRRHRGKLARWPYDTSIAENDIREVLDGWTAQQTIAWRIARGLAWSTLLRGLWCAVKPSGRHGGG